jgi:hypothetical protein
MKLAAIVLCSMFLMTGCIQTLAVSTVGGIVEEGFEAFTGEDDLQFAEKALPGNIKLLEVMLKSAPEDKRLLRLVSEGYSSYALAFLEDSDVVRARAFYLRGKEYGERILGQDAELSKALHGSPDDLRRILSQRTKDAVPGVFWTAFGWASYINLSLTNPDAIADLPTTEVLMDFVAKTDSAYYFGGADLFLGALYGSRPAFFGGDTSVSKQHFEKALRLNHGKFLMTYVYYARSFAVQTQNESLFEELLTKVENTQLDVLPNFRLANAVAKKKAQLLLAKKAELF